MSAEDDGGSAFPVADPSWLSLRTVAESMRAAAGMSLRDYFAAKAMAALIAGPEARDGTDHYDDESNDNTAECAYMIADCMLRSRINQRREP